MTSKVYVALRVKATPERAFQAFVEEIGAWWRPSSLFQTTPRPGVLSFEPGEGGRLIETREGGKVFEIGAIRVWEPPLRLVFSWRQANFPLDLHTEVEVGFEAVGDETRVSVEHRGFDQVSAESAARHGFPDEVLLLRLAEFWRAQIAAVRGTVA
jgi:uncharacterized protein YndB with AHSA1/START domain